MESSELRAGEAIRQARREERSRPSVERRNAAGARRRGKPKGRSLLRRGFVERLARSWLRASL